MLQLFKPVQDEVDLGSTLLFIGVAGALYVLYTKPHLVPGHRYQLQLRPTTATAAPETAAPGRPVMPPAVDTGTISGVQPPTHEG